MIFSVIGIAASQCEYPQLVELIPHPPFLDPFPAKVDVQPDFPDIATATYYLKDFRSYQVYSSGTINFDESVTMQGGRLTLSLNFTLKKSKLTNQQIQFSTDVSFKATLQTTGSLVFHPNLTLNTSLSKFSNVAKLTQKEQKDVVDRILAQVNSSNQQLSLILQSYFQLFKAPLRKSYVYEFQGLSAGINMDVLETNLSATHYAIGYKGQIGNNSCNSWNLPSGSYQSAQMISFKFFQTLFSQFSEQGYLDTAVFNRDSKVGIYDFGLFKTAYAIPSIYDNFASSFSSFVEVNCKLQEINLKLSQQRSLTSHFCFVLESESAVELANFIVNSTQRVQVSHENDMLSVKLVEVEIQNVQFNSKVVQTELGQAWISQVSRLVQGESVLGQGLAMGRRSCSQLKWEQESAIFYEC